MSKRKLSRQQRWRIEKIQAERAKRAEQRDVKDSQKLAAGEYGPERPGRVIAHFGRTLDVQADGDGPMGPTRAVLSKPVIAAISGHAVAGGLELAVWCDLRVADEDAVLGVFCRRWGVPLIDGGTLRLPRLIGLSRALDLILTGRAVGADEALSMGLVNRVAPTGQSRAVAAALAHEIAVHPPLCMAADRASAFEAFDRPLPDALLAEFERGVQVVGVESMAGAKRFAARGDKEDT